MSTWKTMITITRLGVCGALTFAALTGCDAPSFVEDDVRLRPDPPPWLLNTSKVLQSEVPGIDPGAKYFMHAHLGVDIFVNQQAVALDAMWVEDGELRGVLGGDEYGGDDFDGARIHMADQSDPNAGAVLYDIVVEHELDEHNAPIYLLKYGAPDAAPAELHFLCAVDTSFHPVTGTSDPLRMAYLIDSVRYVGDDFEDDPFTMLFGCVSSASGKARHWGYDPDGVVKLNAFRAAVWAITASYCPESGPSTKPGTKFRILDSLGVNASQDLIPPWMVEAKWDEHGATCINPDHRADYVPSSKIYEACVAQLPPCTASSPGVITTMLH